MQIICVLGLGYIGLPTASILATHGFNVVGVDVDPRIVQVLNNGGLPIEEPGLKTIVKAAINSGNLKATLVPEPADIFIIAVPTPVTIEKCANLDFIEAAASSIVPLLTKGNLVVLESTSPPGTTRNYLVPLLEKSGLKAGEEFFVAYCPERVLPGRILKELIENNRIIGGINQASSEAAKKIYSRFVEGEICLTDSTTAEMVKLMENIYRDVNIALANELAIICDRLGISAWEVIALANLHPRVNLHLPGPGVGGHCLAVDPWFIVESFPEETRIITLSRQINEAMPYYVTKNVLRLMEQIENTKITVLGVSYKANIDDIRESPALEILKQLEEKRIEFSVYDPHVKDFSYELSSLSEALLDSDMALIVTDHEEFKFLNPDEIGKLMRRRVVVDTRNCLNHNLWQKNGFTVYVLGKGDLNLEKISLLKA
jgi:UDP-N-acetyl-D-mannosaminuronic acid dehydrogenase